MSEKIFCETCKSDIAIKNYGRHLKSNKHLKYIEISKMDEEPIVDIVDESEDDIRAEHSFATQIKAVEEDTRYQYGMKEYLQTRMNELEKEIKSIKVLLI